MGNTQFKTFEDNKASIDDKIWLLERYLFAKDKQTFFESLVFSSEIFKYMRYSDYLNNPKEYEKDVLETEIVDYLKSIDNCLQDEIQFKYLAQKICESKDTEERKSLMIKMNELYFKCSFDYIDINESVNKIATNKGGSSIQNTKVNETENTKGEVQKGNLSIYDAQASLKDLIDFKASDFATPELAQTNFCRVLQKVHPYLLFELDLDVILKKKIDFIESIFQCAAFVQRPYLINRFKNLEKCLVEFYSNNIYKNRDRNPLESYWSFIDISTQRSISTKLDKVPVELITSILKASLIETDKESKFEFPEIVKKLNQSLKKPHEMLGFLQILINKLLLQESIKYKESQVKTRLTDWINSMWISMEMEHKSEEALTTCCSLESKYKTYFSELNIRTDRIYSEDTSLLEDSLSIIVRADPSAPVENWFKEILSEKEFLKRCAKVRLLAGQKVPNLSSHFSEIELTKMRYEKILKISTKTPQTISQPSQAKITLLAKNMTSIEAVVYEVDVMQYFMQTRNERVSIDIDVVGYKPQFRLNKTFSLPNLLEHEVEFDLSDKIKKQGVYLVELIGEGKSCRALLNIGEVALVREKGEAVDTFYVVDKTNGICKGEATKLHIDSHTYTADEEGRLIVPYERLVDKKGTVLASVESPGGLIIIKRIESYTQVVHSKLDLVYNSSQLDYNSPFTVFFVPTIMIDEREVTRSEELSGVSIRLTYTDRKGIKTINTITNPKNTERVNFEINELLPENTKMIEFQFSAYVKKGVEASEKVTLIKSINIRTDEQKDSFINVFLTKLDDDNMRVELRGKNGEVYPGKQLTIQAKDSFSWPESNPTTVVTDERGRYLLDSFKGLRSLEVGGSNVVCSSKWSSIKAHTLRKLLSSYKIPEGGSLNLPLGAAEGSLPEGQHDFFLSKSTGTTNNKLNQNCSQIVKVIMTSKDTGYLNFSGLLEGTYELTYISINKRIQIQVLKSSKSFPKLMESDHLLTQESKRPNIISKVIRDKSGESITVGIISSDQQSIPTCYLFASEFLIENCNLNLKDYKINSKNTDFEYSINKVVHYSSKKLSAEYEYTLNRRLAPAYTGNTMDKPSTILKRKMIKKTKEKQTKKDFLGNDYEQEDGLLGCKRPDGSNAFMGEMNQVLNQFIKNKGIVEKFPNLSPITGNTDELESSININEIISKYNQVFVVVDWNGYIEISDPLSLNEKREVEKKEVSLVESREPNTISFMQRDIRQFTSYSLSVGTSLKLITRLEELFEVLKLITNSESALSEWSFLTSWSSLSPRNQLEIYDKYMSHELNIFLYFKDKEFTECVVKPHLRNKNKKQVVDYFILGDIDALSDYFNAFSLNNLNDIELSLIITIFKERDHQACRNIVMKLRQELSQPASSKTKPRFNKLSVDSYNERFDSILNSELGSSSSGKPSSLKASSAPKRTAAGLTSDYVPQVSEGVENFNTMGVTNEVIDRGWLLYSPGQSLPSIFWVDYLEHVLEHGDATAFMSQNWIHAGSNPSESLAILSVVALPFSSSLTLSSEEIQCTSEAFILTKKFVTKEQPSDSQSSRTGNVVVSQKYYNAAGKAVEVLNPRERYHMKVIVMNCSDLPLEGMLIVEVPRGAVPLDTTVFTEYLTVVLRPFSTTEHLFTFYFSEACDFKVYPATLTQKGEILAQAAQSEIKVEETAPKDVREVLEKLGRQSADEISTIDLKDVYHKLKDEAFYQEIISILKKRFEFDPVVWSFSIFHGDLPTMREFMKSKFQGRAINLNQFDIFHFKNALFDVDYFNFREYSPLTNPRVHNITQVKHNIINRDFLNTYYIFLKYFQDKGKFDAKDLVSLGVYTLMQDRVKDAVEVFRKIPEGGIGEGEEMKIQYDYLDCYLRFYSRDFDKIKDVCKKYVLYPVLSWRNRFLEVLRQIDEYEEMMENAKGNGSQVKEGAKKDEEEKILQVETDENGLVITYQNVSEVKLSYFEIDLEVLFSTDPSLILSNSRELKTALIPNRIETIILPKNPNETGPKKQMIPFPEYLKSNDLLVRAESEKGSFTLRWFTQSLKVIPIESYGQIKVCNKENEFIPKCYVKCLSKNKGENLYQFYKDGYTDLRGNFDYFSLNASKADTIEEFALFVISPKSGTALLKMKPPSRVYSKETSEIELIGKNWKTVQKAHIENEYWR